MNRHHSSAHDGIQESQICFLHFHRGANSFGEMFFYATNGLKAVAAGKNCQNNDLEVQVELIAMSCYPDKNDN